MAGINSRSPWLAFTKKETTPGTAIAATSAIWIPVKGNSGWDVPDVNLINTDESRGNRAEDNSLIDGVKSLKGKLDDSVVYFEEIVLLMAMCFGKLTTTQPDSVGSPTVYQHEIIMSNDTATDVPFTTTSYENLWDEADHTRKIAGARLDKANLKWARESYFTVSGDLLGTVETALAGAVPTKSYFDNASEALAGWKATVKRDGSAYAGVTDFDVTFDNKLKTFYGANNSQYPSSILYGKFGVSGKATALASRADYDAFNAGTTEALSYEFVGPAIDGSYNKKVTILIPKNRYKVGIDRSKEQVMLNLDLRGLYDSSTGSPLKITVINTKAGTVYQ
jgi:hypothetical protein